MRNMIFGALIVMVLIGIYFGISDQINLPTGKSSQQTDAHFNTNQKPGSLLSSDRMLVLAHRGASGYAPEHTLKSYELGKKMKTDYIEIDLQMTKDDKLVAMHDETLGRTTNGNGAVNDYTLKQIKKLDAGSSFNKANPKKKKKEYRGLKVPTLDEIIQRFGRSVNYYIETKSPEVSPGMVKRLLQVLKTNDLLSSDVPRDKIIVESFNEASLSQVHHKEPSIPLIQLIHTGKEKLSDKDLKSIERYAVGIGVNYKNIDQAYVKRVENQNLLVHAFTVNDKQEMKKLVDWGVTGMFTNDPDRLHEVLQNR